MILICCCSDDPYSLKGIHHFFTKYGISAKIISDGDIDFLSKYKNKICENLLIMRISEGATQMSELKKNILRSLEEGFDDIIVSIITSNNELEIRDDIFKLIGFLLSGDFDEVLPKLSVEQIKMFSKRPIIDFFEKTLFDALSCECQKKNIPFAHKPFWPDDKQFAVCLTHPVCALPVSPGAETNTGRPATAVDC